MLARPCNLGGKKHTRKEVRSGNPEARSEPGAGGRCLRDRAAKSHDQELRKDAGPGRSLTLKQVQMSGRMSQLAFF